MTDPKNYPEIGKGAKYIRADEDGNIAKGFGIVQAIFLDPNKRLMVQIKDGENAWNVDFYGINYTDEVAQGYADLIERVQKITEEGNNLVKETVERYNDAVAEAYTTVLGAPIKAEVPEDDEEDASEEGEQTN